MFLGVTPGGYPLKRTIIGFEARVLLKGDPDEGN